MGHIVLARSGGAFVTADDFGRAALVQWPGAQVLHASATTRLSDVDLTVRISPADDAGFQLFRRSNGTGVFTDGTLRQSAAVAEWCLQFVDASGLELLLIDPDREAVATVRPGMTAAQIESAWDEPLSELR